MKAGDEVDIIGGSCQGRKGTFQRHTKSEKLSDTEIEGKVKFLGVTSLEIGSESECLQVKQDELNALCAHSVGLNENMERLSLNHLRDGQSNWGQ